MPGYAKDFLNDLAWWKRQVQGVGASAFSFFSGMQAWNMGR